MDEWEQKLAAIRRHFDAGVAELLKAADEAAEKAIKRRFGRGWYGGRFQWTHQLPGHGYELVQYGTVDIVIPGGSNTGHLAAGDPGGVLFPIPYKTLTTPVVFVEVQDDPTLHTYEGDYQAYKKNVTRLGVDLYITHFPLSATSFPLSGTVPTDTAYAATGITQTDLAYTGIAGADGAGGQGTTGNTTGNHHHQVLAPGGTGALTDGQSDDHQHHLDDAQHQHDLTEPVTSGHTGHKHDIDLSGTEINLAPDEGADRTITVGWIAIGLQTPPA